MRDLAIIGIDALHEFSQLGRCRGVHRRQLLRQRVTRGYHLVVGELAPRILFPMLHFAVAFAQPLRRHTQPVSGECCILHFAASSDNFRGRGCWIKGASSCPLGGGIGYFGGGLCITDEGCEVFALGGGRECSSDATI